MKLIEEEISRHLWVGGRVQGVGFRWCFKREAQRLGVNGWVGNLPDGRVEAVICGQAQAVVALLYWARRGPTGARVEEVLVEEGCEWHSSFELRATI